MKQLGARVFEAVQFPGRDHDGLILVDIGPFVGDPDFSRACKHLQHFLDRVQMRRCAEPRLALLLEDAKLPRIADRGDPHLGRNPLAPFFERRRRVVDDLHLHYLRNLQEA